MDLPFTNLPEGFTEFEFLGGYYFIFNGETIKLIDVEWMEEEIATILKELEQYQIIFQTKLPSVKKEYGNDTEGHHKFLVEIKECPKEKPTDSRLIEAYKFRQRMLTKRPIFVNGNDGWKMCRFCEELWRKRKPLVGVPKPQETQGIITSKITTVLGASSRI